MEDRLADDERVLAGGFAWVARPRPRVPLLVLARHPHLLGLTDRRLLLWERPQRRKPLDPAHLVLDVALSELSIDAVHATRPMLQVRLHTGEVRAGDAQASNDSRYVIELRPRDRRLGHRLVAATT